ncbi:hypothetical protein, partial [Streptomyces plicatus]|uniref:hypothetical protein n=1 Tax=Streptomyces plicatus TaxID=1922 RepID=UPI001C704079
EKWVTGENPATRTSMVAGDHGPGSPATLGQGRRRPWGLSPPWSPLLFRPFFRLFEVLFRCRFLLIFPDIFPHLLA